MTVYRTDRAVGAAPGDTPLCREDTRLLTGRGEFLDDVAFSGGMIARPKRNSASLTAMRCRLDIAHSAIADAITAFGARCISSDSTVVSTTGIADAPVETRRLARRQCEFHTAAGCEALVDEACQSLRLAFPSDRLAQNQSCLLHRMAVARRPRAEPNLHVVVRIADGDAGHVRVLRRDIDRRLPGDCAAIRQRQRWTGKPTLH